MRKWLFSVEHVVTAVFNKLKRGKAPVCDALTPEHIIYSHPSIVVHLIRLFNMMMLHGYVPDKI